jgi:Holliday junction resolvase RusA-like endonuclease
VRTTRHRAPEPDSEILAICFPVTPTPKVRETRRDKWLTPPRPRVARYRAFANELRARAAKAGFTLPDSGACLGFGIPMPDSWSKKKRLAMEGKPHTQRPDLDNLAKAVFDSLAKEDCGIWHLAGLEKRWSVEGYVAITLTKQPRDRE